MVEIEDHVTMYSVTEVTANNGIFLGWVCDWYAKGPMLEYVALQSVYG